MNVLSLFDGMSCGNLALEKAGIEITNYFSSEVDKYAIQASKAMFPIQIRLGDVRNIDTSKLPKIDLLIGGSPCQSFSFAGKRKGMATKDQQEIVTLEHYLELKAQDYEFEGQSYLFWEFVRILKEVKPTYFLLENVLMVEKWKTVISQTLGINPIQINSALVSAQNRNRLYWTNIGSEQVGLFGHLECMIQQPTDKGILLKDVLENQVDEKYFLSEKMINHLATYHRSKDFINRDFIKKSSTVMASYYKQSSDMDYIIHNMMPRSSKNGNGGTGHLTRMDGKTYCLDTGNTNAVEFYGADYRTDEGLRIRSNGDSYAVSNSTIRRLTPRECLRLQTVPEHHINTILSAGISDTQVYKMAGNGWTVDVIAHIFSYLI